MSQTSKYFLKKIQEAKYKRLKELDLNGFSIVGKLTQIPAEVFELEQLEELDLRDNLLISVPDSIGQLQNLTSIDLHRNQLTAVPDSIDQLQNLALLNLSRNKLTVVPDSIGQLRNLTSLNLGDNQLTAVPDSIGQLQNLTNLDLSWNELTTIPNSIGQLQNLTELNLGNNQLTAVPNSIGRLQNLTELDLITNRLIAVPNSIGQLQNLISLNLGNNQLTAVPDSIGQLQNLTELDLNNNQLTVVPDSIGQLQNLTSLYLSSNQLTVVPDSIGQLQRLTPLGLSNNQLTTLPNSIGQLQNLTRLYLDNNPLETPPPEVVEKGVWAIKDYLRQIEAEGKDYLYEAKLLIVGEGGAGKTTLAKKIENEDYELREEDTTRGIEVIRWEFPLSPDLAGFQNLRGLDKKFRVNIWDFGGQEIYHATHQFFLTKRSLYALVADTRKEDTDFYYWLNVVEMLSDDSPLLVIKNEKQDRRREISERQLRGQFINFKATLATNLATNRDLSEILSQIKHYISSLPHVGMGLPKTWKNVRETLEKEARNHISLDEYLDICQQNGFKQLKDKLQLSGYLHDLGVCLHFQDDPLLKKTVILKPEWGTAAVYEVLDNKTVINKLGRFNRADLENIWDEAEYANMHDELLQLMIKFQLCYKIPGSRDTYIAPQLLTENQPAYGWPEKDNLLLRYTYEFMPKGIITRFIVVMHQLITDQKYVWKSGVLLLTKDKTVAEIIENYGKREIKIRVTGQHKRDMLTIVTHELDKIHSSYKRLKYSKLIPCNCPKCKERQEPHFYPFEVLRQFKADGQSHIQCQKSYQMVDVWGLIDDVMARRQVLGDMEGEDDERRFGGDFGARRNHLRKVISTYQRRLQILKEQQAMLGTKPPPENLIEIEDIEAEIEKLQTELEELERRRR